MACVQLVNPDTATGTTRQLFDVVQQAFGGVPNVARLMANSPAVLNAFLQFSTALGSGLLPQKLQDQVKLAASEANSCDYCLAALCAIGTGHGLSAADITGGRAAKSSDPKSDAVLKFAKRLVTEKGHVSEEDVRTVKSAGLTDGEIVEVIATVVFGFFTNYLNNALKTDVDFDAATPLARSTLGDVD